MHSRTHTYPAILMDEKNDGEFHHARRAIYILIDEKYNRPGNGKYTRNEHGFIKNVTSPEMYVMRYEKTRDEPRSVYERRNVLCVCMTTSGTQ